RARLARRAYASGGEVVAVLQSTRDERHRVSAQRAQRANHDRRRTHPVDVVVAVDENGLLFSQRLRQPRDGAIEILETVGRVKMIESRTKKGLCIIRRVVAAKREQAADRSRERELLLQPIDDGGIRFRREDPAGARPNGNVGGSHTPKLWNG